MTDEQLTHHELWCASLGEMFATMPPHRPPCNCKATWDASAPITLNDVWLRQYADGRIGISTSPVPSTVTQLVESIAAEVRGDAKPVAWMNKDNCIVGNDEGGTAKPLYRHPPPNVVQQLIDALDDLIYQAQQSTEGWFDFDQAKAALLEAKEADYE